MFPDVPNTGLPLSGLTVIDCTIWQQGTYASAMLADFGANVVKVEGPDSPDPGARRSATPTSRATTATSAASSSISSTRKAAKRCFGWPSRPMCSCRTCARA